MNYSMVKFARITEFLDLFSGTIIVSSLKVIFKKRQLTSTLLINRPINKQRLNHINILVANIEQVGQKDSGFLL